MEYTGLETYILNEIYDKFVTDRKTVETKWQENLDAFNSVSTGTWKAEEGEGWRSNHFHGITKIKIVSAWSIITDLLLQGGRLPFTLKYSPWDKIMYEDMSEDEQEGVEDCIEDMRGRIHQQMDDCQAALQLMLLVFSGAMYGESVAKRYVHEVIRAGYNKVSMSPHGLEGYDRYEKYEDGIDSPAFGYTSIWNIFRDMSVDDLQAGIGIVERQFFSPYDLKKKENQPLYLKDAIAEVIAQANKRSDKPKGDSAALPPILRNLKATKSGILGLEFWGRAPTELAEDHEAQMKKKEDSSVSARSDHEFDGNETEIMAMLADGKIIRYARNEKGKRPYYRAVWEIKLDHAEGISVADNLKDVQLVLNGMLRAYEDNLKLTANVMGAIRRDQFGSWDGKFKPGMFLDVDEECDDVRKAMQQLVFQPVGDTILTGIPLMERRADEASQLPRIMQGEVAEKRSPDTAYEMSQLIAQAGKYIGGVIRNHDIGIIEPAVTDFYEYNMADPDYPGKKANLIAKATGFTSYQDRVERLQKLMQAINLGLSHEELAKEHKFREMLEEIYKALDVDPAQVLKSKEEKDEDAQREQSAMEAQKAQMAEMQQLQLEIQKAIEDLKLQRDMEMEKLKHEHKLEEKELEHDLDMEKEVQ